MITGIQYFHAGFYKLRLKYSDKVITPKGTVINAKRSGEAVRRFRIVKDIFDSMI